MNKPQLNNPLPLYFMNDEGMHKLYDGIVTKLYDEVKIDPASAFGDYGCATIYKMNDSGEMELVHVEYLEKRDDNQ